MVPVSRTEGGAGTQILSAIVCKTIQSIKEIVGNHSDADIYVALKETNMDPNEATLKLLNQDPFHEVRRRRDRKKEPRNIGNKGSADPRRHSENVGQGMKSHIPSERNVLRRINYSRNIFQSVGAISKTEQFSRTNVTKPSFPGMTVSRPSLNNQYNSRPHQQLAGHQRVSQQNKKEWKPKSSQKSNSYTSGVIGTPKKAASPPAENSIDIESDAAEVQDKISQLYIYDTQNVIIPQHIRVTKTDRCQLIFGTIGIQLDSSMHESKYPLIEAAESNEESTASLTPELSTDDVPGSKQIDLRDDNITSTGSNSLASAGATSEQQLLDIKDSSNPQNLDDSYASIGLVRDTSPSYAPSESQSQQQDSHDMSGFSAYDPPTGYDIPYFRPTLWDETLRGQGLLSFQEGLSSHAANSIPASSIAMVQQQPPVAHMYPQVHVSHFANLMPYHQFLSPVYVPPMAMLGYSNSSNAPYPHPTNGNSYLLMLGGGSHLNANSLKYGVQQFKPVPAGSPTGFGNFGNPTGYAMISPGVVWGATALEDSSRVKYKDNLYIQNPQAEISEIWLQNPCQIHPGMQSTPYYNLQGQTPHAAYMPSHTGHASFNAAAAQSSHMQFPCMYHTPPQPAAIASHHHHLGPAIGNNVGVGVAAAAPGAQVGGYQQPQLSHLNWTTNF